MSDPSSTGSAATSKAAQATRASRSSSVARIGDGKGPSSRQLLMGNQACAWAALAAGARVVAGYPGTPSSELVDTVADLRRKGIAQGVHVEWSDNEKAALEVLAGASLSGARCLFTCKQMGLNVASDALMSLNYVGVRGGLVLYVADDPGPISSQTEQDTRRYGSFSKVPVLDPSTPEEAVAMVAGAFGLSERYGTPVIVRPTTRVCHATAFFDVPEHTEAREASGFERDSRWVIFPKRSYQAHGEVNERLAKIADELGEAGDPVAVAFGQEGAEDPGAAGPSSAQVPRLGVASGGVSSAYAREAMRMLGERAAREGVRLPACRTMQVTSPFPFPKKKAEAFLDGLDQVLVFEELDHVIEDGLVQVAGARHLGVTVHGKLDGTTLSRGENSTDDCLVRLARFLGVPQLAEAAKATEGAGKGSDDEGAAADAAESAGRSASANPLTPEQQRLLDAVEPPARPPVLCAGCPHRGSFYAVKRALGRRSAAVYCGDIGCYTLGNAKPLDAVDTCLCMGAGITMAQGVATADPKKKALAFVGDSTFFASGMTGVANAVYNQHDITLFVLDNSTTAMTGGQPHPGTGRTLMGTQSTPISIPAVLRALGVRMVLEANPFYLEPSVRAAKAAIGFDGPSAVVFKAPCAQYVRPESPCTVDEGRCTACRVCIAAIGCPAISMKDDMSSVQVDTTQCTGCGLCNDVCPHGALSTECRERDVVPFSADDPDRRSAGMGVVGLSATPEQAAGLSRKAGKGGGAR